MYTPWGSCQHQKQIEKGLWHVSTVRHGGFIITKELANNLLSEAARKRGMDWGEYIAYEEDCDWAILAIEIPQHWGKIFQHSSEHIKNNPRQYLVSTLSGWNADFLLEIGIDPSPEEYKGFLLRQKEEQMRKDNDPDLIVAAWGDWKTGRPGIVQVCTADDQFHFVTEESYDKRIDRETLNLLSLCELAL